MLFLASMFCMEGPSRSRRGLSRNTVLRLIPIVTHQTLHGLKTPCGETGSPLMGAGQISQAMCPPRLAFFASPLSLEQQDANGSDVSEHGTELPAG